MYSRGGESHPHRAKDPITDRLDFEINVELETGLITGHAGAPELIETFCHSGTAAVIDREEHGRLLAALDRLPDAYSDVLRQRILCGLTAAEVAARTGQTANAVRQLQFRAMTALRREFASDQDGADR